MHPAESVMSVMHLRAVAKYQAVMVAKIFQAEVGEEDRWLGDLVDRLIRTSSAQGASHGAAVQDRYTDKALQLEIQDKVGLVYYISAKLKCRTACLLGFCRTFTPQNVCQTRVCMKQNPNKAKRLCKCMAKPGGPGVTQT